MRSKRLIYFIFTVLLLGQHNNSLAQNQSSVEKRALQAFAQQNYATALVDFRQLLAKDQQNPQFNYYYGVCIFQVESHCDAAKYFDVALGLKQIPDPLLYYYRAKIYQEQYFFEQAISAYEDYQRLSLNAKAPLDVSTQIAECRRALTEITAFIRLPLLSVTPTRSPQFYKAYKFTPDDYTFYEAPEVHTKNNAKQGHVPVYAYKRGMKYRIISSFGPKGTQLDLYVQKKDADNNWGAPVLISGGINDPLANEAFGFYDAPSQTLYFSSNSKSIGGYDLYKAAFDLSAQTASQIEKMPYPYSSPTDDVFFVCDALQNQAYFATTRQGIVGQYEIYTLQLDAPLQPNFIFAGNFSNELQPLSKALSLQFTDLLTNEVYGPFVSDATGAYAVALPQKGDFLLEIQVDGASKAYQTRFSIPQLKPQTTLQQQVRYFSDELGKEQWQVRNQLIELDAATQIAGLSQLQFNVAKGALLQAKTVPGQTAQPLQSTLGTTWGFAAQDTTSFIAQMTDTLLAAEVSLENQVRLMELLRQDFEQQLNVREQLLAKLSQSIDAPNSPSERSALLEELAAVEQALAFNQRWIQINQAANIPDLVLLDTLRAMNERHQALLLTGDSLALLAGWTQRREVIQQYLQIAAFDGANALEAAALEQQLTLQRAVRTEDAHKEQQQQIAQQIKQLQTDLPLQSKKDQAQTQAQITALERERQALQAAGTQLRRNREAAAAELLVFDQAQRKEAFLKAAENQSLPQVNLQSSYDELLAQYAQQEDLSKNLKSQLNTSSTTNPNNTTTYPDVPITQRTTTSQPDSNSSENGNVSPTNPISSENGNVSPTNPDVTNSQRTSTSNPNPISTENGNVSPTNPISSENGNVSTTNPDQSNTPTTNISQPDPNSSENGNVSPTNPDITNSQRTSTTNPDQSNTPITTISQPDPISTENGNVSTTNPISSENGNVSTTNPDQSNTPITTISQPDPISTENGNVSPTNPNNTTTNPDQEVIEEKISRFEEQILAISALDSDQLPTTISKIERLGLSMEQLRVLDEQLTLPVSVSTTATTAATQKMDIEAYLQYIAQRQAFEQAKTELLTNQEQIRRIEENYQAQLKDSLIMLLAAQEAIQGRLAAQKQVFTAMSNQEVFEALMAQGYLPTVNNVFQVLEKQAQTLTTPLPVGLPCPQGLVFRVQVGAFRKPVPAERFREFTQVDGQVLANGLTVYMAGYFSTSAEALVQQKLIRSLGYPDAFVVAYQNCNRLSLAQGRALENSPFAAPGQGLYYTVQVGVYNRPLTSEAQIGLSELIEAKTAKGQYRYASGKFANLQDAKKRQQMAVNKGIKDAFIVAYYQGKRIDLAQAKLLAQSGIAFEQNFEPTKVPTLSNALQQQIVAIQIPQTKTLQVPDPICRFEIKCSDCQAELTRYNRVGVFIFDPEKETIVSALQRTSEWDVVQLMYLKEMRKKMPVLKGDTQTIALDPIGSDGAFMDWLLRQQNGYAIGKDNEGQLQLRVVRPSTD